MPGNSNYSEILTTTLANHRDTLIDNIFTARPFMYFLKRADQIRLINGGHKIVLPVIIADNDSAGVYSGTGTITTSISNQMFSAAEYDWKQYAATVMISGLDERKNNGPEEIIDLLDARVMVTEHTIIENLDEKFITGSNTDWLGLDFLVAQNASAVGGIDPSTETYWQSYIENTSEALTIGKMSTAYNTVSEGNDQPNLILTTQTLYEKYEALLQPQLRFTDPKTADAGFQNLMYKGAPVVYDTYVDSGYMYFLNTKYLRLVGHKDSWFHTTPFIRPYNVDARYAQILCMGQLTVSNRNRQGVLTGKS